MYFDEDSFSNAYVTPQGLGLTMIGYLEDPEACYSFDDLAVWEHEDGRLFWAEDMGCSCPSPFEEFTALSHLTPLTNDTWDAFEEAVVGHAASGEWVDDVLVFQDLNDEQSAKKTELLAKVSGLLPPR